MNYRNALSSVFCALLWGAGFVCTLTSPTVAHAQDRRGPWSRWYTINDGYQNKCELSWYAPDSNSVLGGYTWIRLNNHYAITVEFDFDFHVRTREKNPREFDVHETHFGCKGNDINDSEGLFILAMPADVLSFRVVKARLNDPEFGLTEIFPTNELARKRREKEERDEKTRRIEEANRQKQAEEERRQAEAQRKAEAEQKRQKAMNRLDRIVKDGEENQKQVNKVFDALSGAATGSSGAGSESSGTAETGSEIENRGKSSPADNLLPTIPPFRLYYGVFSPSDAKALPVSTTPVKGLDRFGSDRVGLRTASLDISFGHSGPFALHGDYIGIDNRNTALGTVGLRYRPQLIRGVYLTAGGGQVIEARYNNEKLPKTARLLTYSAGLEFHPFHSDMLGLFHLGVEYFGTSSHDKVGESVSKAFRGIHMHIGIGID